MKSYSKETKESTKKALISALHPNKKILTTSIIDLAYEHLDFDELSLYALLKFSGSKTRKEIYEQTSAPSEKTDEVIDRLIDKGWAKEEKWQS